MAFITDEQNAIMNESEKQIAIEREMKSLVKARGFEQSGSYTFDPNPNIQRKEGSIINGVVKGQFSIEFNDGDYIVTLERSSWSESAWKTICASLEYKYHVHTDIDKFILHVKSIDVVISLITPTKE